MVKSWSRYCWVRSMSCGKIRSRGRVRRQIKMPRAKKPASAIWGEPAVRLLRIKVRWGGWRKVIMRCDVERMKPSRVSSVTYSISSGLP